MKSVEADPKYIIRILTHTQRETDVSKKDAIQSVCNFNHVFFIFPQKKTPHIKDFMYFC